MSSQPGMASFHSGTQEEILPSRMGIMQGLQNLPVYQYEPLSSSDTIRILKLAPGPDGSPIRGTLEKIQLSQAPTYIALSYVWGVPEKTHEIAIDGHRLAITASLNHALRDIRGMASVNNATVPLWADAICIDQSNIPERNQQVLLMGSIYSSAAGVSTYIGPSDESTPKGLQLAVKLYHYAQKRGDGTFLDMNVMTGRHTAASGLPPPEDPSWEALRKIMDLPWAGRVWIVQESLLNQDLTMQCGRILVNWNLLGRIANLSLNARIPEVTTAGSGSDFLMLQDDLRSYANDRSYKYPHPKTFYHLLRMCHLLKATDPKDKVYALLGVAHDRSELGIVPNYSNSVAEIYTNVAVRLIQTYSNLDHFSSVYAEKDVALPSWVPDWSTLPENPTETLMNNPILMKKHQNKACGDSKADFSFSDNYTKLHLMGFIIDRVARVDSTTRLPGSVIPPFFESQLDHLSTLPLYADHRESLATWRVLLGDSSRTDNISMNSHSFLEIWLRFDAALSGCPAVLSSVVNAATMKMFQELLAAFVHTVRPRRLFITEKGYIGLGPKDTREGDSVTVLLGGKFPYVLRGAEDGFKLIGESYVHGMMNGEALLLEELVLETITIV